MIYKSKSRPQLITKIVALVVAIAAISILALGCASDRKDLLKQVGETIEQELDHGIKDDIERVFQAGKEKLLKTSYEGRGTIKPVTIVNDQMAAQEVFDASKVGDTDVVSLDIRYTIIPSNEDSGLLENIQKLQDPKAVLTSLIPKTINNKQNVLSLEFSREPSRIYDLGDNRYAEFIIKNEEKTNEIHIKSKVKLLRYDLSAAQASNNAVPISDANLKEYLSSEKYIDKDEPEIKRVAESIEGANEIDIVRKVYDIVTQSLEYDKAKAKNSMSTSYGAAQALSMGKGVCVEYSGLFIALCRAKGIPARYAGGITTEGTDPSQGHAWAEAYIKNLGWVPFDPTWGDTKAVSFDKMKPLYIYLTNVRNDEVLNYSDIFGFRYFGSPIDVEFNATIDSPRAKYIEGLKSSIDVKKAELSQAVGRMDAANAVVEASKSEVDGVKAQLDQLGQQIERAKSDLENGYSNDTGSYSNLVSSYNSLVSVYNEKVNSYNNKLGDYKAAHSQYEAKRKEVNTLVDLYNSLN